MKRIVPLLFVLLCTLLLTGCATDSTGNSCKAVDSSDTMESVSTADSATPETLYQKNPAIDLFVYGGAAYVNAAALDWVSGLELGAEEPLGAIARTHVTGGFQDWDATVLAEDCEIYETERGDILLAAQGGTYVPYLKWVEG